jgi:predicted DNA-binding protein with PD1-like motif
VKVKAKLIHDGPQRTYALVFDRGDEAMQGHGGHLLSGHVRPTLEVILTESPDHLRKRLDPEAGVALIDLDE